MYTVCLQSSRGGIAGGSDGTLHMRALRDASSAEDEQEAEDVFSAGVAARPLLPAHGGACVALTPLQPSQGTSLLVSGACDSTLRVWDLAEAASSTDNKKTCCLFGLGGYKVWLGSVWTDGRRLVSDGRDNAVVVHDFSAEQPVPTEEE